MRPETILAFDTSAAHCAAALLSGGKVLACRVELMEKGQAERLLPMLEEMLAGAGIGWRDLARIGVGTGPGNFTGVRISVALARGLALGLAIPAVGVTMFEAVAGANPYPFWATMAAPRGLVYAQRFPDGTPTILDSMDAADAPVLRREAMRTEDFITAIADLALLKPAASARPAPFYLRGADAAPPSDPPPVIFAGPVAP